jgi:hypothetical protein
MPISVHMFGLRLRIDCTQRTKNGQPAHSTTGVGQHQLDPGARRGRSRIEEAAEHREHESRSPSAAASTRSGDGSR